VDFFPSLDKLTTIFANATAPAFFLGAVAAFVSLMTSRLAAVTDRIKQMKGQAEGEPDAARGSAALLLLVRRARLLNAGIISSLCSGICSTVILAVLFASQFFDMSHALGAPLLFVIATLLLGFALLQFAQEAWLARGELERL
jgi:Protein of unknown function (DUF2721)